MLWIWVLGIFLVCAAPANAVTSTGNGEVRGSVLNLQQQQREEPASVLQKLAQAEVVYLGETHDRPADHQAQLDIIQALQRLRPHLTIAMEMFQRPYQSVLDRYLAGQLTETELQDLSQYKKRWGYSWEFYAPVLRFAKDHNLPVIALNTPTEVTRKTARAGLGSLTLADRRFIPPLSAIVLGPTGYRQRLQQIYTDSHHGDRSNRFESFFEAQVLWDETMAERITQTLQQRPGTLVVVLVGQGHILYGDGIPARVARRLQGGQPRSRPLTQWSVLLNADDPTPQSRPPLADYIWYSP